MSSLASSPAGPPAMRRAGMHPCAQSGARGAEVRMYVHVCLCVFACVSFDRSIQLTNGKTLAVAGRCVLVLLWVCVPSAILAYCMFFMGRATGCRPAAGLLQGPSSTTTGSAMPSPTTAPREAPEQQPVAHLGLDGLFVGCVVRPEELPEGELLSFHVVLGRHHLLYPRTERRTKKKKERK